MPGIVTCPTCNGAGELSLETDPRIEEREPEKPFTSKDFAEVSKNLSKEIIEVELPLSQVSIRFLSPEGIAMPSGCGDTIHAHYFTVDAPGIERLQVVWFEFPRFDYRAPVEATVKIGYHPMLEPIDEGTKLEEILQA